MQIKKFLIKLWDKIKYDESGQMKIGRVSPYIHLINALRSPQKYKEYMLQQAALKKPKATVDTAQEVRVVQPTTGLYNPWAGKSIEEIRATEYERKPSLKPLEAPPATQQTAPSAETAKALAYLKEYVGQMRAAGFSDYLIREKLLKTGSIFIPDVLPTNFGQTGPWATGMADEFRFAAMKSGKNVQGLLEDWIPSPNEYMEYMPGSVANRLPSYSEYTGQETSPFMSPSGKFSQDKIANLRRALANYMTTYEGPKVSPSQYTYEAGIAGLPQELGQQYYQEFLTLAEQKAEEVRSQKDYEDLVMKYPEVQFTPGASVEENAAKIRQYNELMGGQKPELSDVAQLLNDAVYQATMNNEPVNMEDVMNAALMLNIKLSYDEAMAIFNSAKQQALRDMGQ